MNNDERLLAALRAEHERRIVESLNGHRGHDVSIEEEEIGDGDVAIFVHCWTCDSEVIGGLA